MKQLIVDYIPFEILPEQISERLVKLANKVGQLQ